MPDHPTYTPLTPQQRQKFDAYRAGNLEAARAIVADPEKYEGSGLWWWAVRFLEENDGKAD